MVTQTSLCCSRLVYDRETGKPKGYGFCEYQDQETALSAMRNLNGREFSGRALRVDNAASEKNKEELKSTSFVLMGLYVRPVCLSPDGYACCLSYGHAAAFLAFPSLVGLLSFFHCSLRAQVWAPVRPSLSLRMGTTSGPRRLQSPSAGRWLVFPQSRCLSS